jgi:hypothetical protein
MIAVCLGLYPPLMRYVPYLCPENLGLFLICGFMFHFCAMYNGARRLWWHLSAALVYLAYLALAKVFFGNVIAAVLVFSLVLLVWKEARAPVRKAIPVFLLSLIWSLPHLLFT